MANAVPSELVRLTSGLPASTNEVPAIVHDVVPTGMFEVAALTVGTGRIVPITTPDPLVIPYTVTTADRVWPISDCASGATVICSSVPFTAVTDSTFTAVLLEDTNATVGTPADHREVPVSRTIVAPAAKLAEDAAATVGIARMVATTELVLLIPYTVTTAEIVRPM